MSSHTFNLKILRNGVSIHTQPWMHLQLFAKFPVSQMGHIFVLSTNQRWLSYERQQLGQVLPVSSPNLSLSHWRRGTWWRQFLPCSLLHSVSCQPFLHELILKAEPLWTNHLSSKRHTAWYRMSSFTDPPLKGNNLIRNWISKNNCHVVGLYQVSFHVTSYPNLELGQQSFQLNLIVTLGCGGGDLNFPSFSILMSNKYIKDFWHFNFSC